MTMKFENTITLGNLLTAISMALAGTAAWTNMSERVTKVEQIQAAARESDLRHELNLRDAKKEKHETLLEIKQDIKDLRNDIRKTKP